MLISFRTARSPLRDKIHPQTIASSAGWQTAEKRSRGEKARIGEDAISRDSE